MIVVVTGACSNLSSAILPRLVARADVERVIGLDVRAPADPLPGVEYRLADVTEPEIAEHLRGATAVFHLAFVVIGAQRDLARTERINIGGTRRVVEAAIAAGVEHITYASSIAAYGAHPDNAGRVLGEDAPLRGNPEIAYSHTKAEVERMLDAIEAAGPTPPIARLRPCAFLGPRGRGSELLRRSFFPVLRGLADHPAHMAHQDDVADAFVRAFVRRAAGPFNVATDDALPSSEWPRHLGKRPIPLPGPLVLAGLERLAAAGATIDAAMLRFGTLGPIVVSNQRARRELGWRPRFATTADVLRELGGASTRRARLQTRPVFGSLAALLRRWLMRVS